MKNRKFIEDIRSNLEQMLCEAKQFVAPFTVSPSSLKLHAELTQITRDAIKKYPSAFLYSDNLDAALKYYVPALDDQNLKDTCPGVFSKVEEKRFGKITSDEKLQKFLKDYIDWRREITQELEAEAKEEVEEEQVPHQTAAWMKLQAKRYVMPISAMMLIVEQQVSENVAANKFQKIMIELMHKAQNKLTKQRILSERQIDEATATFDGNGIECLAVASFFVYFLTDEDLINFYAVSGNHTPNLPIGALHLSKAADNEALLRINKHLTLAVVML